MKAWHVYGVGKFSGSYCLSVSFGEDEAAARLAWERATSNNFKFLAIEPEPEKPHGMTNEDRIRHLLRQQASSDQPDGNGAPGALLPEARINRALTPFNAEACMRAVRLTCGGRDKERKAKS